ncbi:MAG TPA: SPOR domain-containing protein [Acetobacteraceae bacterium]
MTDEVNLRTPTYRVPSRGMDPATKRLAVIAVALGSALLVVVGAWSVIGHGSGGVPVIAPPAGPMRVKPADAGGMQLSANEDLLSQGTMDPTGGKLAPPPEAPDPQALRAPVQPAPMPVASVAAPPQPVAPAVPALASAGKPAATAAPVAPKVPSAAEPVPAAGHMMVQLGALPTEQAAKDQWSLLQRRFPDLLRGRQPVVSRTEISGHTWWRVRTGGFTDPTEAKGFCDKVRAKGEGCDVLRS